MGMMTESQFEVGEQDGLTVSVVLVNMVGIFVDLLGNALANDGRVRIAGCAGTANELSAILRGSEPKVALVGTQGWSRQANALPFLEQIAATAPNVRTVVMASEMQDDEIISLFHSGARGLICGSEADIPLLTKCLQCVSRGQIWASAAQLDLLIRSLNLPRSQKITNVLGVSLLSKREEQVLHLLASGLSNRELAGALKLSEHTIKNHLFRIFDKLGVSSRMEAVLYALSQRDDQMRQHRMRAPQAEQPGTVAAGLRGSLR